MVPDPESCQTALCKQFRQQTSQANMLVNEQTFEGFLNAQMLTLAVQACDSPIQAPCLLNALEQTLVTNKIIREVFMLAPEQKKLLFIAPFSNNVLCLENNFGKRGKDGFNKLLRWEKQYHCKSSIFF